jgi:hypothetical protein
LAAEYFVVVLAGVFFADCLAGAAFTFPAELDEEV